MEDESNKQPALEGGDVGPPEAGAPDNALVGARIEKEAQIQNTSFLARALIYLLAGTIVVQYAAKLTVLACVGSPQYADVVKSFDDLFNALLPVLSGLVGSIVTFYFTRGPDRGSHGR